MFQEQDDPLGLRAKAAEENLQEASGQQDTKDPLGLRAKASTEQDDPLGLRSATKKKKDSISLDSARIAQRSAAGSEPSPDSRQQADPAPAEAQKPYLDLNKLPQKDTVLDRQSGKQVPKLSADGLVLTEAQKPELDLRRGKTAEELKTINESIGVNKFADFIASTTAPGAQHIAQTLRKQNENWLQMAPEGRLQMREHAQQQAHQQAQQQVDQDRQQLLLKKNELLKAEKAIGAAHFNQREIAEGILKKRRLRSQIEQLEGSISVQQLKPSLITSKIFNNNDEVLSSLKPESELFLDNLRAVDPAAYIDLYRDVYAGTLSHSQKGELIKGALEVKDRQVSQGLSQLEQSGAPERVKTYQQLLEKYNQTAQQAAELASQITGAATLEQKGAYDILYAQSQLMEKQLNDFQDQGIVNDLSEQNGLQYQQQMLFEMVGQADKEYDLFAGQRRQQKTDEFTKEHPLIGRVWEVAKDVYNIVPKVAKMGAVTGEQLYDKTKALMGFDSHTGAYNELSGRFSTADLFESLIATKAELPLLDEKAGINYSNVLNNTTQTLSDMVALLYAGGTYGKALKGVGIGEKVAQGAGLMGASYALSRPDYFDTAIAAGMAPKDAGTFADASAVLTSTLELVSPNKLVFGQQARREFAQEFAKYFAKDGFRYAFQRSLGRLAKEVTAENIQELSQAVGDKAMEFAANKIYNKELFEANLSYREVKETVILTTLATALLTGMGNRSANRQERMDYLFQAGKDFEKFKQSLNHVPGMGDKIALASEVQLYSQAHKGMPQGIKEDVQRAVVPLLVAKKKLEQQLAEPNLDEAFKADAQEKIKNIDQAVIGLTRGLYKPDQVLRTDDPDQAQVNTPENIAGGTAANPAPPAPPAPAPPAPTPPAGTPPAGTPPVGTPPAGTPPAGTPPQATVVRKGTFTHELPELGELAVEELSDGTFNVNFNDGSSQNFNQEDLVALGVDPAKVTFQASPQPAEGKQQSTPEQQAQARYDADPELQALNKADEALFEDIEEHSAYLADLEADLADSPSGFLELRFNQEKAELEAKKRELEQSGAKITARKAAIDQGAAQTTETTQKATTFEQAGEQGKTQKSHKPLGNFLLDNAQEGDTITDQNGEGYVVNKVNTRKDGTKEVLLVPFELLANGEKDLNPMAVKLISTGNTSEAGDLFETSYTNKEGKRVTEQYKYTNNPAQKPAAQKPAAQKPAAQKPAAKPETEKQETENKSDKAAIEARRKAALAANPVYLVPLSIDENSSISEKEEYRKKQQAHQQALKKQDEINAKYDAELAELDKTKGADQGASAVYQQNAQLAKIGSLTEYRSYLGTIFPQSKTPGVFYHGTSLVFDKFKGYVSYFTDSFNYAKKVKVTNDKMMTVLLDLRKPKQIPGHFADVPQEAAKETYKNQQIFAPVAFKPADEASGVDGYIGKDLGQTDGNTIVSFYPNQIHVLGAKADVEGFAAWKKANPATAAPAAENKKEQEPKQDPAAENVKMAPVYDSSGATKADDHENGSKAPARKFTADLVKFSKAVAQLLGLEHDTIRRGKKQVNHWADINIAPAGGDGSFYLWVPGSKYGVYVQFSVDADHRNPYGNDTLSLKPQLMWRLTTRDNKYTGLDNNHTKSSVSAGELAKEVKRKLDFYLKKEAEAKAAAGEAKPAEKQQTEQKQPAEKQEKDNGKGKLKGRYDNSQGQAREKIVADFTRFAKELGKRLALGHSLTGNSQYVDVSASLRYGQVDFWLWHPEVPYGIWVHTKVDQDSIQADPSDPEGFIFDEVRLEPLQIRIVRQGAPYQGMGRVELPIDTGLDWVEAVMGKMLPQMLQADQNHKAAEKARMDAIFKERDEKEAAKKAAEKAAEEKAAAEKAAEQAAAPEQTPEAAEEAKMAAIRKEIEEAEQDFFKSLRKSLNVAGLSTEIIEKGVKLLGLYGKLGIHHFKDIITEISKKMPDAGDFIVKFKGVYAYHYMTSDEALKAQMTTMDEVENFNYQEFLKQQENDNRGSQSVAMGTGAPGIPAGDPSPAADGNAPGKDPGRLPGSQTQPGGTPGNEVARKGDGAGSGTGVGNESGDNAPGKGSPTGAAAGSNTGKPLSENPEKPEVAPEPKAPAPQDQNHQIGQDDVLIEKGEVAKFNANVDALFLLKILEAQKRNPSPAEKQVLARYVGWGGLSKYLGGGYHDDVLRAYIKGGKLRVWDKRSYINLDFSALAKVGIESFSSGSALVEQMRKDIAQQGLALTATEVRASLLPLLLSQQELQSAMVSTNSAHYTPREVIQSMWAMVSRLGFKGGRVLESSAGIGHIFGLMPAQLQDRTSLSAYELDSVTGRILKKLYPQAKVTVDGFEKAKVKLGSQDLVITNVPFGTTAPFDKDFPELSGFSLHNYFIAKNLMLLKPGGLGVMITSMSSMDAASSARFREWVSSPKGGNSLLVGAVRLPNDAFLANAGTEVTSDILIFQKRGETTQEALGQNFRMTGFLTSGLDGAGQEIDLNINEYFLAHPQHLLGEMMTAHQAGSGALFGQSGAATLKAAQGQDLAQALKEALGTLPEDILSAKKPEAEEVVSVEAAEEKDGTLFVRDGKVYMAVEGEGVPMLNISDKKAENIKAYLQMKDTLLELVTLEQSKTGKSEDIEAFRKALNTQYDSFVETYGAIGGRGASFLDELDVEYPIMASLETVKSRIEIKNGREIRVKDYAKASILLERVNFPRTEPTAAENLPDGVDISRNYRGGINTHYIGQLLGISPEQVQEQLLAEDLAFVDPLSGLLQSPDHYLSGNVREKLAQAQRAVLADSSLERNVEALKKVIPEDVPVGLIKHSIGAGWIPARVYEAFMGEKMEVGIKVKYIPATGSFVVESKQISGAANAKVLNTYAAGGLTGLDLFKLSLEGRQAEVSDPVTDEYGNKSYVKNPAKTEAAQAMQKQIQQEFDDWVKATPQAAKITERVYNDRFNALVARVYPIPSFDYYPGASKVKKLRDHQKRAVARAMQESTLFAHSVGTGKTLSMITTAMEMRRLGIARKPMLVVLNSTRGQIITEFKNQYPGAKLLAPSDKELTAKGRRRLIAKIATGNYDCIILPHSQLGMIPDDPQRELAYIREQVEEMTEAMLAMDKNQNRTQINNLQSKVRKLEEEMNKIIKQTSEAVDKEQGVSTPVAAKKGGKNVVKRIGDKAQKIESALRKVLNRRTDKVFNFEELGVDALLIDEAHEFKKLGFSTALQNVKGIDTDKSQKAQSLYLKTRWIQQQTEGRNVHFYTGTPVSNTMAEIWTMMRYLRPKLIADMGISTFDQFVKTFAVADTDIEYTPAGTFKMVNRLTSFQNTHELSRLIHDMSDVVFSEDVREFKESNTLPKLKGGGINRVVVERSQGLADKMQDFLQVLDWFGKLSGDSRKQNSAVPVVMYARAKQAAIDLRLVDPDAFDDPKSKVNTVVDNVMRIYKDTAANRSVQMVFCDMYQSPDPKLQYLDEGSGLESNFYGRPQFNVFKDIRKKLIAQGVPASDIAILTDPKYDKAPVKEALLQAANDGKVRILLGTSAKMGVGVNAQEKMAALHHVDAPARPMDFEQRNGRILRQGNENVEAEILAYGTEKTLDATAYQRLAKKQKMVNDVMKGTSEREVEDAAGEDVMPYDEMMAALSDSGYAMQKFVVDAAIKTEKTRKSNFAARLTRGNKMLGYARANLDLDKKQLEWVQETAQNTKSAFPEGKPTLVSYAGKDFTEKLGEAISGYIKDTLLPKAASSATFTGLGMVRVNGVPLELEYRGRDAFDQQGKKTVEYQLYYTMSELGITVNHEGRGVLVQSGTGEGLITSLRSKIEGIVGQPEKVEQRVKAGEQNISQLEKDITEGYDETELSRLQAESDRYKALMLQEGLAAESQRPKERSSAQQDSSSEQLARRILNMRVSVKRKGQLNSAILGIAAAIYDGALVTLATAIRAGYSMRVAMDKAIAYLKTNGAKMSAAAIEAQLRHELGLRGISTDTPVPPVKDPAESVSAFAQRLVDFRKAFMEQPQVEPPQAQDWFLPEESLKDKGIRKGVDYLRRAQLAEEIAKAAGASITEEESFYVQSQLLDAKTAKKVDDLLDAVVQSPGGRKNALFERVLAAGLSIHELGLFAYAQHAGERNLYNKEKRELEIEAEKARLEFAKSQREAQGKKTNYQDRRLRELASGKLKGFEPIADGGSGMTDAEAEQILRAFSDEGSFDQLRDFALEYRQLVTQPELDMQFENGLISDVEYQQIQERYNFYVPLHVVQKEKKGWTTSIKNLMNVRRVLRASKGSIKDTFDLRHNPVHYGLLQAEKTLVGASKNQVLTVLKDMILHNPNDEVWQVRAIRYIPKYNKDGVAVGLEENTPKEVLAQSVRAFENGKPYYIQIKDELLRRAVSKEGVIKGVQWLDQVNSVFRKLYTTLNPNFIQDNSIRDPQEAMFMLSGKGKKIKTHFFKALPKAFSAILAYEKGDRSSPGARLYQEYLDGGGKITYAQMSSDIERLEQVKEAIAQMQRKEEGLSLNPLKWAKAMAAYVESVSNLLELTTRVAAYDAARKTGMGISQAAHLSRNATVDFAKKGEYSAMVNSLYLFFNAGTQGGFNALMRLSTSKFARQMAGGYAAVGFLTAVLNSLLGDDQDELNNYWQLPEYQRASSLVLKFPGMDGFVKIPTGRALGMPHFIGTLAYGVISGKLSPAQASLSAMRSIGSVINPLGASSEPLQMIAPTILDPAVQAWTNRNAFGGPIVKEQKYGTPKPASQNYFKNTNPMAVATVDWLNQVSGGTSVESGYLDASPNRLEWLVQTLGGGTGNFVKNNLFRFGSTWGEQPLAESLKDMPVVGRFYTNSGNKNLLGPIFEALEESGTNRLSDQDRARYLLQLRQARLAGEISREDLARYRKIYQNNQRRIRVGRMHPEWSQERIDRYIRNRN